MEQLVPHPQVALPDVPNPGDVIAEKYRVEGIIGVGGMGVILGARHLQLGQLVAIKVLTVGSDARDDSVERFLREGRAAAALSSDHVVRIYDVGQLPSGVPFMVMERLRGQDLASVLNDLGPQSIDDSVEFIAQAASAIAEAHEVGIVHRDLKPSNLFLTRRSDGTACVKVLDFGISKQLTDLEAPTLRHALTSTRQVMGSPAYMSPEQVRDAKTVDHRTDIWALGTTLYELLTHCVAFDADTLPAVCAAIVADPPVPLRSRRPEVPEALEKIVLQCLEKSPANRYPSARALLNALRNFQGKASPQRPLSEGRVPLTESSAELDAKIAQDRRPPPELIESGPRSAELAAQIAQNRKPQAELIESGPRSVDPEPAYGTLVSARTPRQAEPAVPSAKASAQAAPVDATNPQRDGDIAEATRTQPNAFIPAIPQHASSARWIAPSILLGLIGVATLGFFAWRQPPHQVSDAKAVEPPPVVAAAVKSHFVLRIDSTPAQALVLEAGNPLGVTPLVLQIEHSVVQQAAREFLLRKAGFADVTIRQGDSAADVQQNVVLAPMASRPDAQATTPVQKLPVAMPGHGKSAQKSNADPSSRTSSPLPSNTAPGIRISR